MAWITLIGPPRNGKTIEVHNLKEGMTFVVGVWVEDCDHQIPAKAINVTYRQERGNVFKSELGLGDFMGQVCHDCLAEAQLRVLTKQLDDIRYTKKYKKELKRIAEAEDWSDYEQD